MSLLTKEERDDLISTLMNGLPLPEDMPIDDLTMQIWQNIAELPHPMDSVFNILGRSSILHVLNESKDKVMTINIDPDQVKFDVLIPRHKISRSDSAVSAFGVMATVGAWNQVLDKIHVKQTDT